MPARSTLIPGFARLLHGGDFNPDQWQDYPDVLAEDERLLELAGCNMMSVGIFAWTSYEPEEGKLRFEWLDRCMDMLARRGAKAALATPSGAKPAWLAKRYPEVRRVNAKGQRDEQGQRHNHCWSSPVYREKVAHINRALAERYAQHPALGMWHISNEYSGECYCALCVAWFQRWLEQKYSSLDRLNAAWWTTFWSHTFTSWDEIDPRDSSIDGLVVDFRRFVNHQLLDFMLWEMKPLRELTPSVPCTTNFMGTHAGDHYPSLAQHLDLVADDQYPAYDAEDPNIAQVAQGVSFKDDLYRAMKPDRPWLVMESCPDAPQWKLPMRLKRPGLHQLEMLQALAHGAEGTCYFQWRKGRGGCEKFHGAVVDHVGHEHTRVFQTVAELGRNYQKLTGIIGSRNEAQVALVFDWDVRWCFEASSGPGHRHEAYVRVAHDHYRPFWQQGVSVDVIASDRDFSGYKLLVTPQLWMLKPGVAERIRRFVEAGGVWVTSYFSAYADEHNLALLGGFPGGGLGELLGIWNEEFDSLPEGKLRKVRAAAGTSALPASMLARDVCEVVHLRGASALAEYAEDFYAGKPALTVNAVGKGRAYYHATKLEDAALSRFYTGLIDELGLPRALGCELPPGVTVQRRITDEQELLFVLSFNATPQSVNLPSGTFRDLLSGEERSGALPLPPWASVVLSRPRA